MPWCEPCGRFYNPNTLTDDGRCPADHAVADPVARLVGSSASAARPDAGRADRPEQAPADDEDNPKVPWHFWLLLIALVIYLGWRLVQGVEWLL